MAEVAGVNRKKRKEKKNYEALAVSYRRKYQTTCTLNFNATHIKLYLSCRLAMVSIILFSSSLLGTWIWLMGLKDLSIGIC